MWPHVQSGHTAGCRGLEKFGCEVTDESRMVRVRRHHVNARPPAAAPRRRMQAARTRVTSSLLSCVRECRDGRGDGARAVTGVMPPTSLRPSLRTWRRPPASPRASPAASARCTQLLRLTTATLTSPRSTQTRRSCARNSPRSATTRGPRLSIAADGRMMKTWRLRETTWATRSRKPFDDRTVADELRLARQQVIKLRIGSRAAATRSTSIPQLRGAGSMPGCSRRGLAGARDARTIACCWQRSAPRRDSIGRGGVRWNVATADAEPIRRGVATAQRLHLTIRRCAVTERQNRSARFSAPQSAGDKLGDKQKRRPLGRR